VTDLPGEVLMQQMSLGLQWQWKLLTAGWPDILGKDPRVPLEHEVSRHCFFEMGLGFL
jgi:hypothetical protein